MNKHSVTSIFEGLLSRKIESRNRVALIASFLLLLSFSSAGAERHLKRESDFERFIGETVLVKLYKSREGIKDFPGVLKAYNKGAVTIEYCGDSITFESSEIAVVRLRIV